MSPDAGGMERARQVAEMLQWSLAVIDKRRESPNVAKALNIIGDVKVCLKQPIEHFLETSSMTSIGSRLCYRGRHA